MIQISNVEKGYGGQNLFEGVSFNINSGERCALVGRNGKGKTTLFRMLSGEEAADAGEILLPKNYRVGYLRQHLVFGEGSVLQEVCAGVGVGEEEGYRAQSILGGLGFTREDMQRPALSFSGGYQIRMELARVVLAEPQLLLLDEPTNYLDILAIRWMVRFLRKWPGEMVVISHDLDFLNQVCTHFLGIQHRKIKKIAGKAEKLFEQFKVEEEMYEKSRLNEEKKRKEVEDFIERFRATASKAALVQSRVKQLEKMEVKEQWEGEDNLQFAFTYAPIVAKSLFKAEGLQFGYTPEKILFSQINLEIMAGDRVGIIGKNGKGKSTLLNCLAGRLTPLAGQVQQHNRLQVAYYGQGHLEQLHPELTIEEEVGSANGDLGRTRVRGLCGAMMFGGELALKKIRVLSGGEKRRVLLAKIMATPANLLFLDEPTNHLDMQSVAALCGAIEKFAGAVVLVTHSEEILRRLAQRLVVFSGEGAFSFNGGYDDFLEKVGWQEEGEDEEEQVGEGKSGEGGGGSDKIEKEVSKKSKDYKKRRQELIQERAKTLNPLRTQVELLEQNIMHLEAQVQRWEEEMMVSAESGDKEKVIKNPKLVKEAQGKVEEYFLQLEEASHKLQEEEMRFQIIFDSLK